MTPMTLRTACIQKTHDLLLRGTWEGCRENPFQYMPPSVVQELLSCLKPEGSERSIVHYRLLLTSGRLEHVTLPPEVHEEEFVDLLQMLSRGCRNLRSLHVRSDLVSGGNSDAQRALREVLRRSTKLQQLHSGIPVVPKDLRNCSNLKTLRLHFDADEPIEAFLGGITSNLWKGPPSLRQPPPLRSVEVLALSSSYLWYRVNCRSLTIAVLLDNCPGLTSLGLFDSSEALKELYDADIRKHGTPRRFQLRRCYWGYRRYVEQSEYGDTIQVAAQSCTLLEVLVIEVRHSFVLKHLNTLSSLTSLLVDFTQCKDDPLPELYSLLHRIGLQLRHLCVVQENDGGPLNVNVIGRSCPNLRTLQILYRNVTADEGLSLGNLERLRISGCVSRSLFPMLSSCPRLKVLCLEQVEWLKDVELRKLIGKNPFAELEVILIWRFSVPESEWRRFIQSASGLRSCCIRSQIPRVDGLLQCVMDLNPNVVHHLPGNFFNLRDEQFPLNQSSSGWL